MRSLTKAALALGLAAIAGCSNDMTILGEDSSNLKAIEQAAARYDSIHGTSIKIRGVSFEELQELANTDLAAGTGQFDIILQYNFSLSSYTRNGWVLSFDEFITRSGMDSSRLAFVEQDVFDDVWMELGHYWNAEGTDHGTGPVGFPFAANTMVLVFNKELFEAHADDFRRSHDGRELAPPATWDEFSQIAQYFTRPSEDLYGLASQGADGGWIYYEWANYAFSLGSGVMQKDWGWQGNANTELLLTSPETVAATVFYLDMTSFADPGSFLTTTVKEQAEMLQAGRAAMGIVWSDYVHNLMYPSNADYSQKFGVVPIPGDVSMIAGGLFYLNRASGRQGAASEFVSYLLEPDVQDAMAREGLLPAYRSGYSEANRADVPYLQAVYESLERGVYMNEAGRDADAIGSILTDHLQELYRKYHNTAENDRHRLVAESLSDVEAAIREQRRHLFGER